MALPKIAIKRFSMTLPMSGKKIDYRPYTVAEENVILQAKEGKDPAEMGVAIANILKVCTSDAIDPDIESYIDCVYAFIMIRAKSINEVANLTIACGHEGCEKECNVSIDLTEAFKTSEIEKTDDKITVTQDDGDIIITLRPMSFNTFIQSDTDASTSDIDILRKSFVSIVQNDEQFELEGISDDEWLEFYSNLPKPVFAQITKYFSKSPNAYLEVTTKCEDGHEKIHKVSGLSNF